MELLSEGVVLRDEAEVSHVVVTVRLARTVAELLAIAELRTIGGELITADASAVVSIEELQRSVAIARDTLPYCIKLITAEGAPISTNWDLAGVGQGEVVRVLIRDKNLCATGGHEHTVAMYTSMWGNAYFCAHCGCEDFDGGCFEGSGCVTLATGRECAIADLKTGMSVLTPTGAADVVGVVKTRCAGGCRHLADVGSGLHLTPGHPVRVKGLWVPASTVGNVSLRLCPFVYNFVLSSGHVLLARGGLEFATLGHGFQESGVQHPYWGSQLVVEYLRACPGWDAGCVERMETACNCGERGRSEGEERQLHMLRSLIAGKGLQPSLIVHEGLLLQLHGAAMEATGVKTEYRNRPVELRGHRHAPAPWQSIPALVASRCMETAALLAGGADACSVAAFCLWWVAHVHPFSDGNGRAARGLACVVLLSPCRSPLSSPTEKPLALSEGIHEQFRRQEVRGEYLAGLLEANEAFGACSCCSVLGQWHAALQWEPKKVGKLTRLLRSLLCA